MSKKYVAVFGATGQVGTPLTQSLLKQGHEVTVITRRRSAANEPGSRDHENRGAKVKVCAEMQRVDAVANAIKGCDTVVGCVPGSIPIIQDSEPIWLSAAVKADVERFVPTEFGSHMSTSRQNASSR